MNEMHETKEIKEMNQIVGLKIESISPHLYFEIEQKRFHLSHGMLI